MACGTCGGGDRWIKTCLTPSGSRVLLCDPCWEKSGLTIVPGDEVVTARCERCGRYANPREFAELRRGGRKDAYGGVCASCSRSPAPDEEIVNKGVSG